MDYALYERGAAARRLAAGGSAPELRHWGTPSVIIRSWRRAVAMISASAAGSFGGASRIASAVETIAFTISPASSWRSSVLQRLEVGEAREVGREVAREEADLAADRVPQRGDAAEALARYEAEVGVVLVHVADEDLDRVADRVLVGPRVRARRADHRPQRPERLVDQDETEFLHVVEVAVEGRRDDARRARHLAQAEA